MGSYKDKTFDPTQKEILAVCETREEAMRTEMFFHEMYDVARNPMFANRAKQTSTGWSTEGTTASEETKQKQREAKTGKESPYKGKKHSEETKQKLREANAGENHPMFGKKLSNETKQKMREASTRKPVLCLETGVVYPSGREAARLLGLNQSSVSRCCNDRSQTCGGYHWTFLEVKND
jgi:group I intron endonuclease